MKKVPEALEKIVDKVLAYHRPSKTKRRKAKRRKRKKNPQEREDSDVRCKHVAV